MKLLICIMQVQSYKKLFFSPQSDNLCLSERRSFVVRLIGSEDQGVNGLPMSLAAVMEG